MKRQLGYALSGIGIAGNIMLALKLPIIAYLLWIICNTGWLIFIKRTGEAKEQIPLWAAYNVINIFGLIMWTG